jgi:hypothetical protein
LQRAKRLWCLLIASRNVKALIGEALANFRMLGDPSLQLADLQAFVAQFVPNSKDRPSSLEQLHSAAWTGVTHDTGPAPDIACASQHSQRRIRSYSALMSAARITLPHFSVSSAINLRASRDNHANVFPDRT